MCKAGALRLSSWCPGQRWSDYSQDVLHSSETRYPRSPSLCRLPLPPQVESTIVELGSIFQQLAHMVHEQGEMAQRIDENVEDTLANVDAGQTQLLKYLNAISSNRFLAMKVFAVLLFFLIFFIVFIA